MGFLSLTHSLQLKNNRGRCAQCINVKQHVREREREMSCPITRKGSATGKLLFLLLLLLLATPAADCLDIQVRFIGMDQNTQDHIQEAWFAASSRVGGLLLVSNSSADVPDYAYNVPQCGPFSSDSVLQQDSLPTKLNLPRAWDSMLVYVYAYENTYTCTQPSSLVAAYSSVCQRNSDKRPIWGFIQLCTLEGALEDTLTHELLHLAGFNPFNLAYSSPQTYALANSVGDQAKASEWGQRHFNCEGAFPYGIPLSPGGDHMRADLVGNDIMVPCMSPYPVVRAVISEGTALIMGSLGFYDVNYSFVDHSWFGFRKGCYLDPDPCASTLDYRNSPDLTCAPSCDATYDHDFVIPLTHEKALQLAATTAVPGRQTQLHLLGDEQAQEEEDRRRRREAAVASAWAWLYIMSCIFILFVALYLASPFNENDTACCLFATFLLSAVFVTVVAYSL